MRRRPAAPPSTRRRQAGLRGRRLPTTALAAALLAALFAGPMAAAPLAAAGSLTRSTLDNGLELYVAENHAVPLVTICVAFRGGAVAQDPEDAGLFHLYEHMMFAGNLRYPTQAAFNAALNRLGAASWNGSTSTDFIKYYITIPATRIGEGLEFWSWAITEPQFDEAKLAVEKEVVINEIRGYHNDPDQIMENALESRAFPTYPWRKNVDGPEDNVRKATVAQLEAMRAKYYIPANAALLMGGDLRPDEAAALAKRWFGGWKGGPAPAIGEPAQPALAPGIALAFPDESFYEGIAQVQLRWRGPDSLRDSGDSYASDVLQSLLSSPAGRFKRTLMDKGPGVYDPGYIDFRYSTARDGADFSFSTYLLAGGSGKRGNLLDRAERLRELVLGELSSVARDPEAYFGPGELQKAKVKLVDKNLQRAEVAGSYVTGTLAYWWSAASSEYYAGYEAACLAVSYADVAAVARRYLAGGSEPRPASAIAVRVLASEYASDPTMTERERALGYSIVSADNAFWWQR